MAPTAAANNVQIEALVEFMMENKELARGLLRDAGGRARSKRLWENLCNSLNSMGSYKSVEQWQRVWADRKHLAKKAFEAARRSANTIVGGRSMASTLSQIDSKIMSIVIDGFGEPQTLARVPAFPTGISEREPVAISPTHTATSVDPLSQEQPSTSTENEEDTELAASLPQWTPSGVPQTTSELPMQNQQKLNRRRARHRIRRHLSDDSVRIRILEVEQQRLSIETTRNDVLNEIKVAIQELCTLVREHLTGNS